MDYINLNIPKEKSGMKLNFWILISLAFIIVLMVSIFIIKPTYFSKKQSVAISDNIVISDNQEKVLEMNDISSKEMVSILPDGLLMEKNANVISSFSALSEKGTKQNSLSYVSNKSLIENVNLFVKYLKENNWSIISSMTSNDQAVFDCMQTNENREALKRLNISINKSDKYNGKYTVDLTETYNSNQIEK